MKSFYSIGLDFGTNSVRALLLDLFSGEEIASETEKYPRGELGVLLDKKNPHLARQYPGDYLVSFEKVFAKILKKARSFGIPLDNIQGIGSDGTGSSPLPVDETATPLAFKKEFKDNLNAQTWLWKDHTSAAEAAEITDLARKMRPAYLKKCGGAYSSEWFFSKIFHCLKVDPKVFKTAYSWLELSDYIPSMLCGITDVRKVKRNICAAGHKAMFHTDWGGLPEAEFLEHLSPDMAELMNRLYSQALTSDNIAGLLSREWCRKFELPKTIPVAVGALDAHLGAVGSGVGKGIFVKIIGTSTCDIMVQPDDGTELDIPGVAGIVPGSVLPGYIGIEAGQSAVGDIFNWFVSRVRNEDEKHHLVLTKQAEKLKAGESGLLALDWNNGNRNILTDPHLTGLLVGQTLHTTDYEIYRALIEATAFGARRIIEQMEDHGVNIEQVINCGGIAEKNPLVMQIYADVLHRPMHVAKSAQTVALGAAIYGGFAALKGEKGFENIEEVQNRICRVKEKVYNPREKEVKKYQRLYQLYKKLHDGFGIKNTSLEMYPVMKELLEIKRSA